MAQKSIIVAYSELHELQSGELACLSESETQRAGQFKAQRRRQQFLCGRALLRALLERYTGDRGASHEVITDDNGKPICVGGPAVSIAHSGDTVICAATSQGEIGVDIEVPGRRRDIQGIADNYFAEDEAARLATLPDEHFYMLWVLKEAWLKATGSGLAGGLDRLRCIVTPPHIAADVADNGLAAASLYAIDDALVGIATTVAAHDAIVVDRWDPDSGRFAANSAVRLIASTDPASPRV